MRRRGARSASCAAAAGVLTCTRGDLGASASVAYDLKLRLLTPGT
jgi:hypothetical protein